jgi:hypothetical protein
MLWLAVLVWRRGRKAQHSSTGAQQCVQLCLAVAGHNANRKSKILLSTIASASIDIQCWHVVPVIGIDLNAPAISCFEAYTLESK